MARTWQGEKPTQCDACEGDFLRSTSFVDGVIHCSTGSTWGLFHVTCFKRHNGTYGVGRGQRYDMKTLERIT